MLHIRKLSVLVIVGLALVLVVPVALAQMTPAVIVGDQPIVNDTVTVETVVSDGPGWIVIHTQADGRPGPVIGFAPLVSGENTAVMVDVDGAAATDTLYAMLHTDAGEAGVYEFPGDDSPVSMDGAIVMTGFQVTTAMDAADAPAADPVALPETGGQTLPWNLLMVAVGLLALVSGAALLLRHRSSQTN